FKEASSKITHPRKLSPKITYPRMISPKIAFPMRTVCFQRGFFKDNASKEAFSKDRVSNESRLFSKRLLQR
uniref:hypothetical protein n=1 Tax=Phocaeicola vulgatus TaxID=821 RepID=UPI00402A05B2